MTSFRDAVPEHLLVREITHRVNNEFASAIQVVSLTAARSSNRDVKVALAAVIEQLHNYARVHHALQMPANNETIDASAYLRDLCQSISRSKLESRNIELVLVEDSFQMSAERCWMMGMIVVELITNAVRHAFRQQGGTVRIECLAFGGCIECRVSDDGSAMADIAPGNGLRIIEALAQPLGASLDFRSGEGGTEFILALPIEPICADKPAKTCIAASMRSMSDEVTL
jgi:two-component sensor histidine kinase